RCSGLERRASIAISVRTGAGVVGESRGLKKGDETEQAATCDVAVAAAAEQTTCAAMEGNSVNKATFVEYKGKKVYFCCQGCPERFLADAAQYVAKLRRFNE
ncbi:MAG: YHS domain-containing protein, partial [Phycisphaerales bacterium]